MEEWRGIAVGGPDGLRPGFVGGGVESGEGFHEEVSARGTGRAKTSRPAVGGEGGLRPGFVEGGVDCGEGVHEEVSARGTATARASRPGACNQWTSSVV